MDVPQVARLKKAVDDNSQGRCQLKSLAKFGKVSINDRIVHTSCEGGASVRGMIIQTVCGEEEVAKKKSA